MATTKKRRKQLFKAALYCAGITAAQWAEKNKVTPQWVSAVLNGHTISARLTVKMDEFIAAELGKQQVALAS